jgi:metallo-beta-lactamase class B
MARDRTPESEKPKKDMVVTDGMKLRLGGTTLSFYLTPGHTTGTISTLIPLKEGNQLHTGIIWGGLGPQRPAGATMVETLNTYLASLKRGHEIASAANADVYLLIHPRWDKGLDKLRALDFRNPSDPNPFVSKKAVNRFFTVMSECLEAQLARVAG